MRVGILGIGVINLIAILLIFLFNITFEHDLGIVKNKPLPFQKVAFDIWRQVIDPCS
jgi:hypothetical protein